MAAFSPNVSVYINDSTSSGNPSIQMVPHASILIIAYATIFILSIVGNSLMCVLLRNPGEDFVGFNFYVLNLAIADIIITLTIPFEAIYFILDHTFLFGNFMCKLLPFLRGTAVHASSLLLVIISYERYRAVMTTYKYNNEAKVSIFSISFAWLSGIASAAVNLVNNNVSSIFNNTKLCLDYTPTANGKVYVLLIFILFFAIPIIILSVYHTLIIIHLSDLVKGQVFKHSNANKTKSRVTVVVFLITISYFICYAPQYIIHIIFRFQLQAVLSKSFNTAMTVTYWMAYSHSIWNPLIYGFTSTKIRQKMFKLWQPQVDSSAQSKPGSAQRVYSLS